MGLVQLFREVPCPDLMARHLLDAALADFRESGHHYLMNLVAQRDHARRRGDAQEIEALTTKIHEHTINEQLPQRWDVDFLFSQRGYEAIGDQVLAVWATILIEICTLEQHWEGALLGYPPENPYLLPGFHPAEAIGDTAWLEEAQRTWSGDLRVSVLADAARVLRVVTLPPEASTTADEEHHDITPKEAELHAADAGPWVM